MSLSGDMPLVGGKRFGIYPRSTQPEVIRVMVMPHIDINPCHISDNSIKASSFPQVVPAPAQPNPFAAAPKPAPAPIATQYLSATKMPLSIGQYIRGSDKTRNRIVNPNFRGHVLEFFPLNDYGNNVRVKCERTGKVFRVNATEIRSAK